MSALSETFAQHLSANPDALYPVVITLQPNAANWSPDGALESASIQPLEGLQGIYKASLPGREILKLRQDGRIQAIEPDDLMFNALK